MKGKKGKAGGREWGERKKGKRQRKRKNETKES